MAHAAGRVEYAGMQPHAPHAVFAHHRDHGRIALAIVGATFDTGRLEGEAVVLLPDGTTCVVSGLAARGMEVAGVGQTPDPRMLAAEEAKRANDAVLGTGPALLSRNGGLG